jgi:apolipoprotein D and lipocalin family protein
MKFSKLPWFLLGVSIISCSLLPAQPLKLAEDVDLSRIQGGWYILAAIPNSFERHLVGMYDYYSLLPDGSIREDFFTHRNSFSSSQEHFRAHDTISAGTHNALWHVHFFGPISAPFPVLYASPDSNYLLFGYPNRRLAWIYSRFPTIDEKTYQELLRHFAAEGYETSRFRKIVQFPDQLNKLGFSTPPK